MYRYDSAYNPPTIQAGEDACYGRADPIKEFGDTLETERLIEEPTVQKRLLKGDVPYKCSDCQVIFLVDHQVMQYYRREFYNYHSENRNFKPPRGLTCIKSRYTINRSKCPPQVTTNTAAGSAHVSGVVFPYDTTTVGNNNAKRITNP